MANPKIIIKSDSKNYAQFYMIFRKKSENIFLNHTNFQYNVDYVHTYINTIRNKYGFKLPSRRKSRLSRRLNRATSY